MLNSTTAAKNHAISLVRGAMEALWLAAAGLVPLAMAPEGAMADFIQVPKVALLRIIVLVVSALWACEWALTPKAGPGGPHRSLRSRFLGYFRGSPAGWIILAAVAFLAANIISTLLSPVYRVSLWGQEPGSDSYSLFAVAMYLVLFFAVATHLRSQAQIQRLLWVVIGAATVASSYGIAQRFGFDPLLSISKSQVRVTSTFGNPIFFGAFLVMAIPVTLAATLSLGQRWNPLARVMVAAVPVSIQVTAIDFTLSRGPWVGLGIALAVLLLLAGVALGRRLLGMAAAAVAISIAVSAIVTLVPPRNAGSETSSAAVAQRASSIYDEVSGGGIGGRLDMWKTSGKLIEGHPWVDTNQYPELPSLTVAPLRPLVGYGPDMFPYAYLLAGDPQLDGGRPFSPHNFIVMEMVDLGVLGVVTYIGLLAALAVVAILLILRVRRSSYPLSLTLALIAIASALAGRVVEQMSGIAHVSDLTLFWLLAGALVSIAVIAGQFDTEPAPAPATSLPRRRQPASVNGWKLGMALASAVVLVWLMWLTSIRYVPAAAIGASARTDLQNGAFLEGVRALDRAIALTPDKASYRLNRTAGLAALGANATDPEEKARLLNQAYRGVLAALGRNPMNQNAWNLAGDYVWRLARLDKDKVPEAERTHEIMTVLMPGYYLTHNAMAAVYLEFQQPKLAVDPLLRSLAITGESPISAQGLFLLGEALKDLSKPQQAVSVLEKSVSLAPTYQAHKLLADLYTGLGDRSKAAENASRAEALKAAS